MKALWHGIAVVILATAAAPASEGPSGRARLVEPADLAKRLGAPGLRILDPRARAEYDKGHIPGAVWVDARAVEALAARPGALTDRAAWEAWIKPLGIGPETEVVVCDGARQLEAARLWWLLTYLGVEKVGLLDGNVPLWSREGRPTTAAAPEVAPRPFPVAFRADRHATRDEVLAALRAGTSRIVDARSAGEFAGTVKRSRRGGHIPTACHMEWLNLVDKDGRFLDEAALRAGLERAGVKAGEPVIAHCQAGGRASVDAFVLERLGFPTRNYYLGWSDWGNVEETPVATEGSGPDKP